MTTRKITPKKLGSASLLAAGMAICSAAALASNKVTSVTDPFRLGAREACHNALDILWHQQSTHAARKAFDLDATTFYRACGWSD